MRKIVVRAEPMGRGFQALAADDKRIWARGVSIDDAIGNLIRTHPEAFSVELVVEESANRQARELTEDALKERAKREAARG